MEGSVNARRCCGAFLAGVLVLETAELASESPIDAACPRWASCWAAISLGPPPDVPESPMEYPPVPGPLILSTAAKHASATATLGALSISLK
jgi:hypothetical protein